MSCGRDVPGDEAREPAGLARRLAALIYDLMLLGGVLFMFTLAVFALREGRPVPPGTLWFQLCLAALVVGFFTGFWVHGGQTLGMRAWRLRVVDRGGRPIGWGTALKRFAAGLAAALPAGLGLWWVALDRDGLAWHDRLSGTRVVRERAEAPRAEPPAPGSGDGPVSAGVRKRRG